MNEFVETEEPQNLTEVLTNKLARQIDKNQVKVEKAMAFIEHQGTFLQDYVVPLGHKGKVSFDTSGNKVKMLLGNDESFEIRPHALAQTAEKLAIPATYLKGLAFGTENWGTRLAANIMNEHTFNTKRQRLLVRTVEGNVLGVLSDQYRRLDTGKIYSSFIKGITEQGAKVIDCFADETRSYIETISPLLLPVQTPNNGVVHLAYGVRISSSDFGDGALDVRAFIMQAVCMNGMVMERSMREIHFGKQIPEDLEISKQTFEYDTKTKASLVYDIVRQSYNTDKVRVKALQIQAASGTEIEIDNEIKKLVSKGAISKTEGDGINKVFVNNDPEDGVQGKATLFKLTQGISAIARTAEERRKRELQEIAGSLMEPIKVK